MALVTLALDCKTNLGESPVALPSGELFLVDINGKAIHRYDTVSGAHAVKTMPQMVGCIVPRAKGGFLAAMEDPIVATNFGVLDAGEPLCAIPEGHGGPKFRFNDGKCDPTGRFWVGTMISSWRDPESPPGRLYVLDPLKGGDKLPQLEEKIYPTRLTNGLAWSADTTKMYWIDSFYKTVELFDFVASTGEISGRRKVVKVDDEPGPPDGMAIDSTDKLWVVVGESGSVRQYDPETGAEIMRVDLPVQRPTSCAFGGKDLSELYVTTREQKGDVPGAGGLFRCTVPGVKGASFAVPYAG
eukprot:TRINITY_DN8004_c0_g1_i1.p1 TRINITY_DN8004_c0_g1~~TRINITY_DN8004_c0_g1_i1.p1  ORF type:complete len:299 (+),score=43.01 TRINITY_DN8004_c0_g1_i1:229-1125(+)